MKFLCVECDEVMALTEYQAPEAPTMTALFELASCGFEVAMGRKRDGNSVRAQPGLRGGRAGRAQGAAVVKTNDAIFMAISRGSNSTVCQL